MATRPKDEQCQQVAEICITALSERFAAEKSLFVSSSSLTDVRILKAQLFNGTIGKIRSEPDPHKIVGVLLSCLKDMPTPLLADVYESVISMDFIEDKESNKINIWAWIINIHPSRFETIKSLFGLLNKVLTTGMNDYTSIQLAYNVAASICRPKGSAYMSIRHQEDLRRIRPVLAYIMDNFSAIFPKELKPRPIQVTPALKSLQTMAGHRIDEISTGRGPISTGVGLGLSLSDSTSLHVNTTSGDAHSLLPLQQHKQQTLASGGLFSRAESTAQEATCKDELAAGSMSNDTAMSITDVSDSTSSASSVGGVGTNYQPPLNFNSWEWKVLEGLAIQRVDAFCKARDMTSSSSAAASTGKRGVASSKITDATASTLSAVTYAGACTGGVRSRNDSRRRHRRESNDRMFENLEFDSADELEPDFEYETRGELGAAVRDRSDSWGGQGDEVIEFESQDDQIQDSDADVGGTSKSYRAESIGPIGPGFVGTLPNKLRGGENNVGLSAPHAIKKGAVSGAFGPIGAQFGHSGADRPGTPATGLLGKKMDSGAEYAGRKGCSKGGASRSGGKRAELRKRIAECKQLRTQIMRFEEEWLSTHSRPPKSSDRGDMQAIYTQYRTLKKNIRDDAATSIQRCSLLFLARCRRVAGTVGAAGLAGLARCDGGTDEGSSSAGKRKNADAGHNLPDAKSTTTHSRDEGSLPGQATAIVVPGQVSVPASVSDVFARYRTLMALKMNLKKQLKRFDDDFLQQQGRHPKKADKEIMRPMYQRYHEVKNELDDLRQELESVHGPLPADLMAHDLPTLADGYISQGGMSDDEQSRPRKGVGLGSDALEMSTAAGGDRDFHGAGVGGVFEAEDDDIAGAQLQTPNLCASGGSGSLSYTWPGPYTGSERPTSGGAAENLLAGLEAGGSSPVVSLSASLNSMNPILSHGGHADTLLTSRSTPDLLSNLAAVSYADLQEEKKNLHSYLKAYERDFNRANGRPVMRHEDIQPVAAEYKRYKELKSQIKAMKP